MTTTAFLPLSGPALSEALAERVMHWQPMATTPGVAEHGSIWVDAKGNWHLIPRRPMRKRDEGLFGIVAGSVGTPPGHAGGLAGLHGRTRGDEDASLGERPILCRDR